MHQRRAMRAAGAACVCACLVVPAVLRGERDGQRPTNAIQALVSDYRRGDAEAAMREFLAWDPQRVAREATLPADAPPADLAALALMHTAAAVARGTFGNASTPPVPDRTYYPAAANLVEALSRRAETAADPGLRAFCRDWYIVAVSAWTAGGNYAQALAVVRTGRRRFGDDARFLLAAGSAAEAAMGPYESPAEAAAARAPSTPTITVRRLASHGYVTDDRREAEQWLRRAVTLDPGLVEARLRLGRVLFLVDYVPQARKELERALADATAADHPFAAYLAALFLGELLERSSQTDAARQAYEKAISINPECQAAYLALGHLLVASGRPAEGWTQARRLFGDTSPPRVRAPDPWFLYRGAQFWQSETLLKGMVQWVRN